MSKWIKKGDRVLVIAGNDRGKVGDVVARQKDRVIVQGVNIRKKHAKRRQKTPGAEIIDIEMPIHISNVAFCDSEAKPVKAKVRIGANGVKELYYLSGEKEVALRRISKQS